MNHIRIRSAALAAALAVAGGAAHAVTLIDEGFDLVDRIESRGWVRLNLSSPVGTTVGWTNGDASIFSSQSGSPESYASVGYNAGSPGGSLSVWLESPVFSTATAVQVSFWARADMAAGYFDQIAYGISNGSTAATSFALTQPVTLNGDWAKYTVNIAAGGAGSTARFAIVYTGQDDNANFVGVDSFTVNAVPEPAAWMLMAGGLLAVGALHRRRNAR